jgi:hypothetical protein
MAYIGRIGAIPMWATSWRPLHANSSPRASADGWDCRASTTMFEAVRGLHRIMKRFYGRPGTRNDDRDDSREKAPFA